MRWRLSIPARKYMVDLRRRRRYMIETGIKILRQRTQIFRKTLRIKNLGEPPKPYQAVHRWRKIHPAERHFRRQMHPVGAHRLDRSPGGVVSYRRGELLIDGHDHLGIPGQNL